MGENSTHIVDQLIEERAQKLMSRPWLWKTLKKPLYALLGYKKARELADICADMTGHEAFSYLNNDIGVTTTVDGMEHVPPDGPVIFIANHPTGLGDGMYAFDVLKPIRPDFQFLANADALRAVPASGDLIIPVEWVQEKRTAGKTKQTLFAMKRAMGQGRALVIFPSGRLAKLTWKGLVDKEWQATAISFARKNKIPVIPMHIKARNSALYYIFCWLHPELRDITLFHEMINKGGQTAKIKFGPVLDPNDLGENSKTATQNMREIVEELGRS